MAKSYQRFYRRLFAPLEKQLGRLDRDTLVPLVGFEFGGPLSLCTIGGQNAFVNYVSCELAVREDQEKGECGSYELLIMCDNEQWARSVLTNIGRMSLQVQFGHQHTLDIGAWVDAECSLQGILFEQVVCVRIDGQRHGILRCHGITKPELKSAKKMGPAHLLDQLKVKGIYPRTEVTRASIV